jgi:hypothetical protein
MANYVQFIKLNVLSVKFILFCHVNNLIKCLSEQSRIKYKFYFILEDIFAYNYLLIFKDRHILIMIFLIMLFV